MRRPSFKLPFQQPFRLPFQLSFQWRVALMTALLIAGACVVLNLLLYRSGAFYLDSLSGFVLEYGGESVGEGAGEGAGETADAASGAGEGPADGAIYIDIPREQMGEFVERFSAEVDDTKVGFGQRGWLITVAVTLISSIVAYFVSGRSLRPLREFAAQAERVDLSTLSQVRLDEGTVPEFRQLSRALNRMLERLTQAFDAQRQFVGNAAHELRTPLALMQARLELHASEQSGACGATAVSGAAAPTPTAAVPATAESECLAAVRELTERLTRLVNALLDMSGLQNVPREDRVQLAPMVEEVLTDLAPVAEKRGVELVQSGGDAVLRGSDVLLYRMLFNLVENGIRYNRPGGRVTVDISRVAEGRVRLSVRDTGRGIPEEFRESVYQPFFRVDASRSRELGGSGLGLALVWEIVRLHGGEVRIESADGGTGADGTCDGVLDGGTGTSVVVTLPVDGEACGGDA